ncbi:winged helix-turn-helix transcriptional regulator [Vibrio parahaemolyticus]|uniref:helix-turn-helix domain-containing protein n=1 Tax=Vibrio parahaemolyticus TaxID=670 RepID=UPI00084A3770|nr:helix-turn-helix domain-containing protein [Vibrio parahaemolyticus]EHH2867045.1 winged helix-turn-helix transcriptional regulator [Vibrio parahaemolyticus]ELA9316615.1 winged helix-turn-helix transcriptional regulator [Vibrio parahaemolyticus]MBM5036925.1 winged helix-turn-helix transcriptional regulator [Vibrio parahaemolyticus]MBM5050629.1 winged helix-turn-helix transcriptional regulator [Vibrio parahaemolyticus]MBM5078021.1 winged helix-turn-helix transcriptional regulator [Vibrio para
MWWIASPVVACVAKAVYDAVENNGEIDISDRYKSLDKNSKNELIQELSKSGMSQHLIAKSLGISPSAVSQRLKGKETPKVQVTTNQFDKLIEVKRLGLSNEAIAKMLTSEVNTITSDEVASFFKVIEAAEQELSQGNAK